MLQKKTLSLCHISFYKKKEMCVCIYECVQFCKIFSFLTPFKFIHPQEYIKKMNIYNSLHNT